MSMTILSGEWRVKSFTVTGPETPIVTSAAPFPGMMLSDVTAASRAAGT
jgi:hypothetical protein